MELAGATFSDTKGYGQIAPLGWSHESEVRRIVIGNTRIAMRLNVRSGVNVLDIS